jgi:hypothetical protein
VDVEIGIEASEVVGIFVGSVHGDLDLVVAERGE